jgi:copper chaperone CopZ
MSARVNPNNQSMKNLFLSIVATSALVLSARAGDVSTKLTGVHLCCAGCVKGVTKAVDGIQGVTATASQDDGTVTLTGPDTATVQKAADALVAAGYFGKSSDPAIKINADTGAKGEKVKSLDVQNVHLCCGKCVKAVNTALGEVNGVTGNTAAKGAKSFTVNGDFNDKEVFSALQKAGLTGQAK